MKQGKRLGLAAASVVMALAIAGCGGGSGSSSGGDKAAFDLAKDIHVISREDGSGTRGAFVELLGIEVKENGKKVDRTLSSAQITNSTNVMMTSVANDAYALGYISLGSLNDTVKALKVDGVEATPANVMNGQYKLARPFNVVISKEKGLTPQAEDFLKFIHSKEGQKIVNDNGYIAVDQAPAAYTPANQSGKIVCAGSSSVTPVMEKLAEAYQKANPNLKVEVQQSDSTTGVQSAISGTADLGMASRELKDSEKGKVDGNVIAKDGLAVVVNKANSVENIKADSVRDVYIGKITKWQDAK